MPVPSPRNKILPVRGNIATLQSNVGSLSEGEICYALDENRIYIVEGGALVPTDADATASLFDAGTEALPGLAVTGDPNTGIYSPGADQLAISTAGTGRLFIDASGGVGIGASNSLSELLVTGSNPSIYVKPNADTETSELGFRNAANTQTRGFVNYNHSSESMSFRVNLAEAMRIDNAGKVGIGTTSPDEKLVVNSGRIKLLHNSITGYIGSPLAGQFDITTNSGDIVFGTGGFTEKLRITSGGNVGIGTSSPRTNLDVAGNIYMNGNTQIQIATTANTAGLQLIGQDSAESIIGTMSAQPLVLRTTAQERLRIDSAGNVGIGVTSPGAKLDVDGGNVVTMIVGGDSTASGRTDAAIKVGRIAFPHYTNAEEPVAGLMGNLTGGNNAVQIGGGSSLMNAATVLQFYTAGNTTTVTGTERMRIDSAGKVGIGTSSPQQKLHISDTVTGAVARIETTGTQAAIVFKDSNTGGNFPRIASIGNVLALRGGTTNDSLFIDSSGNVGIGTTAPGANLAINGNAATTGHGIHLARNGYTAIGRFGYQSASGSELWITNNYNPTTGAADSGEGGSLCFASNGETRFVTANTERMRIDSAGKVGIGTSSVTHALTVTTSGTDAVKINTADYGYLDLSNGTSTVRLQNVASVPRIGTATNHPLVFAVNEAEKMRLTATGLGIGTTSPSTRLTVVESGTSTAAEILIAGTNTNGDASCQARIGAVQDGALTSGALTFSTRLSGTTSERARIDSSGRLLVGTSSASTGGGLTPRLQVQGADAATSLLIQRDIASDAPPYIVLAKTRAGAGNVGLVVNNDSLGRLVFAGGDGVDVASVGAEIGAFVDGTSSANDLPTRLVFSTTADGASSPTERMRIKSTGAIRCVTAFTVATLPTGEVGDLARVTDASSPSIGSTVAGGGAANALCWYNGSNWTVMGV